MALRYTFNKARPMTSKYEFASKYDRKVSRNSYFVNENVEIL